MDSSVVYPFSGFDLVPNTVIFSHYFFSFCSGHNFSGAVITQVLFKNNFMLCFGITCGNGKEKKFLLGTVIMNLFKEVISVAVELSSG